MGGKQHKYLKSHKGCSWRGSGTASASHPPQQSQHSQVTHTARPYPKIWWSDIKSTKTASSHSVLWYNNTSAHRPGLPFWIWEMWLPYLAPALQPPLHGSSSHHILKCSKIPKKFGNCHPQLKLVQCLYWKAGMNLPLSDLFLFKNEAVCYLSH